MADKIRWGIMGAGRIIERWIKGAKQIEDMEIAAIASRSMKSAVEAAKKYEIKDAVGYEELVVRDDIDVIYVAVPHMAHKSLAMMAMEHGKHVLVEKPIAVNSEDLKKMIECAKQNNVFLMEAFWTRFFPLVKTIRGLINEDGIGEVRAVNAAFSYRVGADMVEGRTLNPHLAGGGLLDVGVYNLHFCDLIYDKYPISLTGFAAIDSDKNHFMVDEQAVYIAKYDKGELASMASGVRTNMIDTAYIYGTNGYIELPTFWKPTQMKVTIDGKTQKYNEPVSLLNPEYEDEGFQYEIDHVNDCIRKGIIESPVMTWDKSLRVLKQCDELRKQWGLQYPFEQK